jgi:hypothetical protein
MHRLDRVARRSSALGRELVQPTPAAHPVLALQRAHGNHATARMLSRVLVTTSAALTPAAGANQRPLAGNDLVSIGAMLDRYHATKRDDERLAAVRVLQHLADRWLKNAQLLVGRLNAVDPRVAMVRSLADELDDERDELETELKKQAGYLHQLRTRGFVWPSTYAVNAPAEAEEMSQGRAGAGPGQSQQAVDLAQAAGLSAAEIAAIRVYTGDDFKYINPAMAAQPGEHDRLKGSDDVLRGGSHLAALYPRWQALSDHRKARLIKEYRKKHKLREDAQVDPGMVFTQGGWKAAMTKQDWAGMAAEGVEHGQAAARALAKLDPYTGDTYRGEQLTEEDAAKRWTVGAQFTSRQFYSTSRSRDVARHFSRNPPNDEKPVKVLITFRQKTGRDVSLLSAAPPKPELVDALGDGGEQEVLLLPGATIKVVEVKPRRKKTTHWEWRVIAEEVTAEESEEEDGTSESESEDEDVAAVPAVSSSSSAMPSPPGRWMF